MRYAPAACLIICLALALRQAIIKLQARQLIAETEHALHAHSSGR